jgi:hypothetical protein
MPGHWQFGSPFWFAEFCPQITFPPVRFDLFFASCTLILRLLLSNLPLSRSSTGRTKTSNPTKAETGLPGKPMKGLSRYFPNASGLPGRMFTRQKFNEPLASITSLHSQMHPHLPLQMRGSNHFFLMRFLKKRFHRFSVSFATPSRMTSPPAPLNGMLPVYTNLNRGSCLVQAVHPLQAIHHRKRAGNARLFINLHVCNPKHRQQDPGPAA